MHSYENTRRVCYGDEEIAQFIPVCPNCGRYVKADESINGVEEPNATCSKCGRVSMPCEGIF